MEKFDHHKVAMETLCYICGHRINNNGRFQLIEGEYLDNIISLYGNKILELDIKREIAPKHTCQSCFASVKILLNKKESTGSFKTSKWPRVWVLCTFNSSCETCQHYLHLSKKGRLKKAMRKGRHKDEEIISHGTWEKEKIPFSSSYKGRDFKVGVEMTYRYTCLHCEELVKPPFLILTCCSRLACYKCFVEYVEGQFISETKCVSCNSKINYSKLATIWMR